MSLLPDETFLDKLVGVALDGFDGQPELVSEVLPLDSGGAGFLDGGEEGGAVGSGGFLGVGGGVGLDEGAGFGMFEPDGGWFLSGGAFLDGEADAFAGLLHTDDESGVGGESGVAAGGALVGATAAGGSALGFAVVVEQGDGDGAGEGEADQGGADGPQVSFVG